MTSSRRTAICACPNSRRLSLLPCFLTSFLLFPPAGWRGARRRFVSGPLQIDSSAAVLVFLLMAASPATRAGPPAGVLAGVPEAGLPPAVPPKFLGHCIVASLLRCNFGRPLPLPRLVCSSRHLSLVAM